MGLAVISEEYCKETERELLVRKTSLFAQGDGFSVYDHRTGELTFRVDIYPSVSGEVVLMDPNGKPILSVRKKLPSLHNRWEGFRGGEKIGGQNLKPLFTVRRSTIFGGDGAGMLVEVLGGVGAIEAETDYIRIEGSFPHRSCKILLEGNLEKEEEAEVVAEIKRKVDADSPREVIGKDVFSLLISPGVDAAFAMGLVLVLDQVCSDEPEGTTEGSVHPDDHLIGVNGVGNLSKFEEHPSDMVMLTILL
ncbi:hypothetical protein LUZ60_001515 [Juncus effusus]|nr:hypothetical protein LUZ60_001515 [Juncus effusus]